MPVGGYGWTLIPVSYGEFVTAEFSGAEARGVDGQMEFEQQF